MLRRLRLRLRRAGWLLSTRISGPATNNGGWLALAGCGGTEQQAAGLQLQIDQVITPANSGLVYFLIILQKFLNFHRIESCGTCIKH